MPHSFSLNTQTRALRKNNIFLLDKSKPHQKNNISILVIRRTQKGVFRKLLTLIPLQWRRSSPHFQTHTHFSASNYATNNSHQLEVFVRALANVYFPSPHHHHQSDYSIATKQRKHRIALRAIVAQLFWRQVQLSESDIV